MDAPNWNEAIALFEVRRWQEIEDLHKRLNSLTSNPRTTRDKDALALVNKIKRLVTNMEALDGQSEYE